MNEKSNNITDRSIRLRSAQAFNYEDGQFICHVYSNLSEQDQSVLNELACVFSRSTRWSRFDSNQTALHLTLLRGHRALYYNHIRPLLSDLKNICMSHRPIKLFLSDLKIFHNQEKTKEFLCLVATTNSETNIKNLKDSLKSQIDQYAIRLNEEDETLETLTHCSFLYREYVQSAASALVSEVEELTNLCNEVIGEVPVLILTISQIKLSIGCKVYDFQLRGN